MREGSISEETQARKVRVRPLDRRFFLRTVTALGLGLTGVASTVPHSRQAGFRPLFNGHDLEGWDGDPRLWRVVDGAIVGSTEETSIDQNSFLSTVDVFSDFVLDISVRLRNHNSGVQFRSRRLPEFGVAGYQADIAEERYFGMLYEEQGRGFFEYWNEMSDSERAAVHAQARQGQWNRYRITCRGDRVRIELNGVTTCDISDPEGARKGVIALQLHTGPPMQVRFKEISIRSLS